jgi:hypothetical protein
MDIVNELEGFQQRHPDERALWSFGGVTDEIIQQAESEVGIPFPESYKRFLRQYGQAYIGEYHFVLGVANPERSDALQDCVSVTQRLRRDARGDFPSHFLAFVSDNGEMYYCFDASMPRDEQEYPVVRYFPFEGVEPGFADFSAFVEYAIGFYES